MTSSAEVGKPVVDRPLTSDFWRVCVGVVLGLLIGLGFVILKPPGVYVPFVFIILGAAVAGPTLFVALLVNYKRRVRGLPLRERWNHRRDGLRSWHCILMNGSTSRCLPFASL